MINIITNAAHRDMARISQAAMSPSDSTFAMRNVRAVALAPALPSALASALASALTLPVALVPGLTLALLLVQRYSLDWGR